MDIQMKNKENISLELTIEEVKNSHGVFVIIGGSGKIDKNGNHRLFKMNIYQDISKILNSLGYSTIRYSKRGTGSSEGNHNVTGLSDLLSDLQEIVEYTKENYVNEKLYLLGHSEGAMLATLYTKENYVDGMVLVSGAGIALKEAMQIQNKYLSDEIKYLKGLKGKLLRLLINEKKIHKQQLKIFNKVENTTKDMIRVQLVPVPAKWMREHFKLKSKDYIELLSKTKIPTLVIQGDKDAHTSLEYINNIEKLQNDSITVNILNNIDHILRDYTGDLSILNIKKQYKKEIKKAISNSFELALKDWVI